MTTTTNYGFPKPVITDRVADGWDAIADLADAVDTTMLTKASKTGAETLTNKTLTSPVINRGAWTAFTLTTGGSSGITLGNATQSCAYRLVDDKTLEVRIALVAGTTTTITATVVLGPLPYAVLGSDQMGSAWWYRSTAIQRAGISSYSGTQMVRAVLAADGYYNNTTGSGVSAGDIFRAAAVLELA